MSGHTHDPWADAQRFGSVLVVVDIVNDGCMVQAPQPGPCGNVVRSFRLHGLDEINGAYQLQRGLTATSPVAADIVRALKFAAQQLQNSGKGKT
jgi:hypothetical protein